MVEIFGFRAESLEKSLKIITGPKTDLEGLRRIVRDGMHGVSSEGVFVLYKRNGDEVCCTVRAEGVEGGDVRLGFTVWGGVVAKPAVVVEQGVLVMHSYI
jgi:hypothetical protein